MAISNRSTRLAIPVRCLLMSSTSVFKSEFSEEMGTKAWNTFEDYKHYRKHYEYLLNQKKEHEENINATIKKMKKAS